MKLTLMIEGSASAIAAILASLPADGVSAAVAAPAPMPAPAPLAASYAGTPVPMPVAAAPAPVGDVADEGAPNAAPPAFDVTGLPWDERIHAGTKVTTESGEWRKKRGVAKETIAAVEAELRAAGIAANPAPAPVPMPVAAAPFPMPEQAPAPVPMPTPFPAAAPVLMPAPAAMAFPAPVAMPAPEPAPMPAPAPLAAVAPAIEAAAAQTIPALDFQQFMTHLSTQMQQRDAAGAPLIHADYLASLTSEIGVAFGVQLNAITDIASDPNKINFAVQAMQRDGRW